VGTRENYDFRRCAAGGTLTVAMLIHPAGASKGHRNLLPASFAVIVVAIVILLALLAQTAHA
jgi:hypothetical protein